MRQERQELPTGLEQGGFRGVEQAGTHGVPSMGACEAFHTLRSVVVPGQFVGTGQATVRPGRAEI